MINSMKEWVSDWKYISVNEFSSLEFFEVDDEYSFGDYKPTKVVVAYMKQVDFDNLNPEYKEVSNANITVSNTGFNESGIQDALNTILLNASVNGLIYNGERYNKVNTEAYNEWLAKREQLAEKTATAKEEFDAITVHKNLKLIANIAIEKEGKYAWPEKMTWPEDCELDGDFHRIEGVGTTAATALFGINKGTIKNIVSQDGRLAYNIGEFGKVTDCIVYTGSNRYGVYNHNGDPSYYNDIVEAVYTMRDNYGYSFSEKKAGAVKDDNKLYQAKYTNAELYAAAEDKGDESSYVRSFKVNIKDKALEYSGTKLSLSNAVVYIDDTDANDNSNVSMLTNVAVKKGKNYVCTNAVLTDGANLVDKKNDSRGFYAPYNFTAERLSYDRNIAQKYVAVCLPFELTSGKLREMGATAYTFKDALTRDGKNFIRFELIDDQAEEQTVTANTPCILSFSDGANTSAFKNYSNVSVVSTAGASLLSNNSLLGNYGAYQEYSDLVDQAKGKGVENPVIYGIQGGEFVKMNGASHMHAFRSFIALPDGSTLESRFTISLLDEEGNEEVTGIELVSMANDDTDFKAVGSRNAIEVTTGKACDVKVYTLNGALAKTARVEAGTTTLPMNAGMYVVNKTKVIVK